MRSAIRSLGAIKLGGGVYTNINNHVWLKNIKLLSLPGICATHDGLLRAPLTTVVARGREGGGGEDDLEPPTAAAWATAATLTVVVRRDHHRIMVHRTPVCAHPTTFRCLLPPMLIVKSPLAAGNRRHRRRPCRPCSVECGLPPPLPRRRPPPPPSPSPPSSSSSTSPPADAAAAVAAIAAAEALHNARLWF